ncbi:exopolyphosphatase/guanosine-5'-triphosphate,3'-diphosphate pyrophosphatase [Streptosporangium becharense]|uniref:Exopolyphosphatase/guanosine-5'-triphosphate, 3'-diphosphate pyrophosphatase n=1 Tax=Streptosporangium becharense TaxID=1816182 RepID=A0A7W9MI27_9ACTN|nr:Ppx/GppA phosphatase family protein [Streptosporangium becharense]MBB2913378.1 exopolyphosphatase/guanosine-5'-triphosphate,3'-diphosphate pyrophosphatase [Streptosporangium becharense]MBB5821068.1 exopolyphosphatase/guanosine-5'-triphosphate,3'-diphosphate pyrophosphatase [Streptosporangium becharense]
MTRVAAIDCGTNSVRLLIADIGHDRLTDVERRMEIVRLGQGVDKTGRLAPEALERTFAAMRGYAELIDRHGAGAVRVVATSATRDAANRQEFTDGVREIFGVEPEVITGAEEAELSFVGATHDLVRFSFETGLPTPDGTRPPYLVVDIGGGSTEFVLGSTHVEAALSVDIGCVRLTERHLRDAGDPPAAEAVEAVIADIDDALDRVAAEVPVERALTLVGLAGSVTTVVGMALNLPEYDPKKIHHARIAAHDVHDVTERLLGMTVGQRTAIPVMHPGRADVIGAGALILDRVMTRYGFGEVVASERDILDGIAWSVAKR